VGRTLADSSIVVLVLVRRIHVRLLHTLLSCFTSKIDPKVFKWQRAIAGTEAHPSGDGHLKVKVGLDKAVLSGRIGCVYLNSLFAHELFPDHLFEFVQRDVPAILWFFHRLVIGPDHPRSNVLSRAIKDEWDGDVIDSEGARRRKRELVHGW
jgi:hypothetical protein